MDHWTSPSSVRLCSTIGRSLDSLDPFGARDGSTILLTTNLPSRAAEYVVLEFAGTY